MAASDVDKPLRLEDLGKRYGMIPEGSAINDFLEFRGSYFQWHTAHNGDEVLI